MAISPKPTSGPWRENFFQLRNFRFARHPTTITLLGILVSP